jgi:hypothetical protein
MNAIRRDSEKMELVVVRSVDDVYRFYGRHTYRP